MGRFGWIAGALAGSALMGLLAPAHADVALWCAHISDSDDHVTERCEYRTFEACRNAIVGQGPSFCVQNPGYNPGPPQRSRSTKRPRNHKR